MGLDVEGWIRAVHEARPDAQFVSLEPDDGRNALLSAYWMPASEGAVRIVTYANLPFGKSEFVLDMLTAGDEESAEWALAALQFADDHRHLSDLVPGALFASAAPLVDFSPLDGWVVGVAETVSEAGLADAHLHLHPIYTAEIETLKAVGLTRFLARLGQASALPHRGPIQKEPR